MAKSGITFTLNIAGARETLKAFHDLPKDASDELRDASQKLAGTFSRKVRAAALAEGRQAAVLAATVTTPRDRVPVVQAGGSKRIGRNRKPAFKLIFGSEFGSHRLKQFRPHRGAASYWFFRSVEKGQAEIAAGWNDAADRIIAKFTRGG